MPFLDSRLYNSAIPLFARYLDRYSQDTGVRREYALTLVKAGHADRAIPLLEELLALDDDSDLRLLLARTLRDQGRVGDASMHYRLLSGPAANAEAYTLEWARALEWIEDYDAAQRVLRDGLDRNPDSVVLTAELARAYYYSGRLEMSRLILAGMSEMDRQAGGVQALRDQVIRELDSPSPIVSPPRRTLLEQAIDAREAGDRGRASALFEAALAEVPDDLATWQAYADFLQYVLEDFPAALAALAEVERLCRCDDGLLQYRMALLEIWTNRPASAQSRLEALLTALERPRPTEDTQPSRADVHALLGDLERWSGHTLPAVRNYELAIADDPSHLRAGEGLSILRATVAQMVMEADPPGMGGMVRSWADTDAFRNHDALAVWSVLRHDWVWGTHAGRRWLEGLDLNGTGRSRAGLVAYLEGAHWLRWGTIRLGATLGFQTVREAAVDLSAGLSARLVGGPGTFQEVTYDHAPAYTITNTLQSVTTNVQYDRLSVSLARSIDERWSVSATTSLASLDHKNLSGTARNYRVDGGVSLGSVVSRSVTLGGAVRGLRYVSPAPRPSGAPLYWDPTISLSVGPYAQVRQTLGVRWELNAHVNPGVSWIDERGSGGGEIVPDLAGRVGLVSEGSRYRTGVEFFFGQGRFTGYRSYGASFSLTARTGSRGNQ